MRVPSYDFVTICISKVVMFTRPPHLPYHSSPQALRSFLEIDKAVLRYQQQQQQRQVTPLGTQSAGPSAVATSPRSTEGGGGFGETSSHAPPVAGSEFGGGDWDDDSRSEVSGFSLAPSSVFSHLQPPPPPHLRQQQQQQQQQQQRLHSSQTGEAPSLRNHHHVSTAAGTAVAAEVVAMRLGIKLESRADVRRLVDVLEQRLGTAGRDLQVRMHACEGGQGLLLVRMHAKDG